MAYLEWCDKNDTTLDIYDSIVDYFNYLDDPTQEIFTCSLRKYEDNGEMDNDIITLSCLFHGKMCSLNFNKYSLLDVESAKLIEIMDVMQLVILDHVGDTDDAKKILTDIVDMFDV